jgi:divalent metal cation (Fe/Co/Zn/Cd) transporter
MASCCEDKSCDLTALQERHGRVLWVVLSINAVMFLVEGGAGVMAHSTSLLADALDMLGDALVYGFSLFVLARSARWQAGAALAKGGFMLADSIVGLLITVAIFWLVGQSGTIGKLLAQVDGTR